VGEQYFSYIMARTSYIQGPRWLNELGSWIT